MRVKSLFFILHQLFLKLFWKFSANFLKKNNCPDDNQRAKLEENNIKINYTKVIFQFISSFIYIYVNVVSYMRKYVFSFKAVENEHCLLFLIACQPSRII